MAKRSRPAQGHNSTPARSPRPAYRQDAAPTVVSAGTASRPRDTRWGKLKRLVQDATPRVIQS